MAKRIYVGNLPWSITDKDLEDMFAAVGKVNSASIVKEMGGTRSRGFGFVEMENDAEAEAAITKFNGFKMDVGAGKDPRPLTVNEARPRAERPAGGERRFERRGPSNGARQQW